MKALFVTFSSITFSIEFPVIIIIILSIKQNIGHVWILRPHTLGKLICQIIFLSIKQNLSYV